MAARHLSSEREVTIDKKRLIDKLIENRQEHSIIYDEARIGFQSELKAKMRSVGDWLLDAAKIPGNDLNEIAEKLSSLDEMESPKSYLIAYDEAIELFNWDESATITLTVAEFRKFVLNKWDWQNHFLISNSRYSSTARRQAKK